MKDKNFRLPGTLTMCVLAVLMPLAESAGQVHEDMPDKDHERRVVVNIQNRMPGGLWSIGANGYLGINMLELTPELRTHFGVAEDTGIMISSVEEDSPAAKAGLQVGDILTSIDGEQVTGSRSVVGMIAPHEEGEVVALGIFRDGGHNDLNVTLEKRERPQLWLNGLGDGDETWEFRSEGGDNVFVLPGPNAEGMRLRRESLDGVMGHLHERLASPDFQNQMVEWRSNTGELEDRIKELEQRLKELASKLEEIER
jgi:membrane-associated protease RseP (regulator of RpoE activity)